MSFLDEVLNLLDKQHNKPTGNSEPVAMKTYKIGGKGRKQCVHCNVYVGVRTKVCVCGEDFKKRTKTTSAAAILEIEDPEVKPAILFARSLGFNSNAVVWAPVGAPPVKFKGNIETWVRDTMGHYFSLQKKVLSPRALRYWLRQFFDDPTDTELVTALKELDEFVYEMSGENF